MHLYLIRHGESEVNVRAHELENLDAGLTVWGQKQAKALAGWIVREVPTPAAIYASTMQRTRETAEFVTAVYPQSQISFDDRLREFGNCYTDHRPIEAENLRLGHDPGYGMGSPYQSSMPDFEGMESWMDCRNRVGKFIEEVSAFHQAEDHMIVVCHGNVINAAMDHIFNVGAHRQCEFWSKNTGVTHVERLSGALFRWRLHYQNRYEHLQGLT